MFESIILEVGADKVSSIVTDGTANMMAAHKLVAEDYPRIQSIRCASHTLNLLAKDIEKLHTAMDHLSHCKEIIKVFKLQHIPSAVLRRIQKEKKIEKTLILPSPTRWGSVTNVMQRMQINRVALQLAAIEDSVAPLLDKSVRRNIMDNDIFWQKNEQFLKLMAPVSAAILFLEGDRAILSEAVEQFKIMRQAIEASLQQSPLSKAEEIKTVSALNDRYRDMITPTHKAAYLLDPRYAGQGQSEEDFTTAVNLIIHLSGIEGNDIVSEIANFRERIGRFSSKHIWNIWRTDVVGDIEGCFGTSTIATTSGKGKGPAKVIQSTTAKKIKSTSISASTWWGGLCTNSPLSKVAQMLLTIPPSSAAAAERNFSSFSTVHTKKRNRLTTLRASKLVYIYHNSRLLKQMKPDVDEGKEADEYESHDHDDHDDDGAGAGGSNEIYIHSSLITDNID